MLGYEEKRASLDQKLAAVVVAGDVAAAKDIQAAYRLIVMRMRVN